MYDLAIINGTVIDPRRDGTFAANVYCKDGIIADVSANTQDAARVIDAGGMYVSPGFLDIHGHIEGHAASGRMLRRQGVTTVVNGNCGMGQPDLPAFLARLRRNGFVMNQSQLSGATTLRERAGQADPYLPLSRSQLSAVVRLLEADFDAGASGLSFGLEYVPGTSLEEIMELSRVAAQRGKPVAAHIRSDCAAGLDALDEMFHVSRETGARVQISHVVYQFGYGYMREALDKIAAAVRAGLDISCDSGMYTSFATRIGSAVFDDGCLEKWGCGYDAIYTPGGRYARRRLTGQMFEELRRDFPDTSAIALIGNEAEIPLAFELPYMMCSSDAGVAEMTGGHAQDAHPQDAGTFPRFLRKLVRESARLSLPDAIRRITLLPALRMGFVRKGRMEPGCDADITVFDLDAIADNACFPHEGDPCAVPSGIQSVIIHGKIAEGKG
ncbi:MAG: amidohydrolase family protein [Clostridium sp.]|jgi:N-acyl-D-amino-acid deacylase|nr:amidohydrolase family protein [Clostridium sp.]